MGISGDVPGLMTNEQVHGYQWRCPWTNGHGQVMLLFIVTGSSVLNPNLRPRLQNYGNFPKKCLFSINRGWCFHGITWELVGSQGIL